MAKDVTTELERKMLVLERKQDEVLLDEKKMPILEFGRDAEVILKDAANAFVRHQTFVNLSGIPKTLSI